jgi:hypothetical protein
LKRLIGTENRKIKAREGLTSLAFIISRSLILGWIIGKG